MSKSVYCKEHLPIEFKSNPELSPIPHIEESVNDVGSPVNQVVFRARDNKSPFEGSHYDPDKHSLRALLRMGVELTPVNYGQIENDPNKITAQSRKLINEINSAAAARAAARAQAAAAAAAAAVIQEPVEPAKV